MSTTEIVLIILGIIVILLSFKVIERSSEDSVTGLSGEDDLKQKKLELVEQLNSISEDVVEKADDQLSRISNEKIIAVGEYSDQILEKINHNHEEVVFLYQMMTEKEKELKNLVQKLEQSKRNSDTVIKAKASKNQIPEENRLRGEMQIDMQAKNLSAASNNIKVISTLEGATRSQEVTNHNKEILALHAEGKTVIEISRLLSLGQGEVKLVIDLFRSR